VRRMVVFRYVTRRSDQKVSSVSIEVHEHIYGNT
jgi:hypothetical protein